MRSSAIASPSLLLALLLSCAAPVPAPMPSRFEVPVTVPNGVVVLEVERAYRVGAPIEVTALVKVASGRIEGPIAARVVFSTMSEGEALVRTLPSTAIAAVAVTAGASARARVAWDGRDDRGAVAQPESYQLVLTFRSLVDAREREVEAGTTIEVRARD